MTAHCGVASMTVMAESAGIRLSPASHRTGAALATALLPVVLVVVVFSVDRAPRQWPAELVVALAVQAGFALAAALLFRAPGQRRTALILAAATGCQVIGSVRAPDAGVGVYLAATIGPLFWVFAGWALLRFPFDAVLRKHSRVFLVCAATWLGAVHAIVHLFLDPSWYPSIWPGHPMWPTVVHSRVLYDRLQLIMVCGDTVIACWYAVIMVRRVRAMAGLDRWITAPLGASVIAAVGPLLARPTAYAIGTQNALRGADITMNAMLLLIPVAILAVLVRQRITRFAVADMMAGLRTSANTDGVVTALRRALRDPELTIRFWSPVTGSYVDADGRPAGDPEPGRQRVPVTASDGSHLAEVVVAGTLDHHRDLVDAAVSASALALENARLRADLRAQLEATRASRRRIAEAGVEERRRLERDLHDGVQQRLLALTLRLAEMRAHGSDAGTVVETTRAELHAALAELRELARGIHPTVLAQSGLGPALEDVVERLPLPVRLTVAADRWPPAVEATAYFIVCEALSNAVKHADANQVEIVARPAPGATLVVTVTDDGRGGADPWHGTGLRGMRDRVRALGGRFSVESPPGRGTRVLIELPTDEQP